LLKMEPFSQNDNQQALNFRTMNTPDFHLAEIKKEDKTIIDAFVAESWGSCIVISRGRIHNVPELPGFICKKNSEVIGLITFAIHEKDCEIVTLVSTVENSGLATQLINKVVEVAEQVGCDRIWLITTNDNTHAIRFYQKRGFEWIGFHRDAVKKSRKLKPEIPEFGEHGIPIKHEIEFEYRFGR